MIPVGGLRKISGKLRAACTQQLDLNYKIEKSIYISDQRLLETTCRAQFRPTMVLDNSLQLHGLPLATIRFPGLTNTDSIHSSSPEWNVSSYLAKGFQKVNTFLLLHLVTNRIQHEHNLNPSPKSSLAEKKHKAGNWTDQAEENVKTEKGAAIYSYIYNLSFRGYIDGQDIVLENLEKSNNHLFTKVFQLILLF